MSSIVFRKNGGFYSVYGDDTYILYYLFNYRIIDDRVGFPINAFSKVVNVLIMIMLILKREISIVSM